MKYAVESAWSIYPGMVRPHRRGYLPLKSANPRDSPEIHLENLLRSSIQILFPENEGF
jgi:hypothetical protein